MRTGSGVLEKEGYELIGGSAREREVFVFFMPIRMGFFPACHAESVDFSLYLSLVLLVSSEVKVPTCCLSDLKEPPTALCCPPPPPRPLNYLSHCSSGPQYELICIQPIRDRAYSFAYSQTTAGDSTLGIN